jgi:hypothetical protein
MAPPGEVLRNEQRRAAALVALVRAGAAADPVIGGRADVAVVIDHQTLLGQLAAAPTVHLGDGTPIPADEARRLACGARIIPTVLGSPSRPLDVGRATRLATDAQRAALRAVHLTCCIHNCDVGFDHCEIHHIDWWRNGGPTDLDNLVPLCGKHHHLVHDTAWDLVVDADRAGSLERVGGDRHASRAPARPSPQRRSSPRRTGSPEPVTVPALRHASSRPDMVPMRC